MHMCVCKKVMYSLLHLAILVKSIYLAVLDLSCSMCAVKLRHTGSRAHGLSSCGVWS